MSVWSTKQAKYVKADGRVRVEKAQKMRRPCPAIALQELFGGLLTLYRFRHTRRQSGAGGYDLNAQGRPHKCWGRDVTTESLQWWGASPALCELKNDVDQN